MDKKNFNAISFFSLHQSIIVHEYNDEYEIIVPSGIQVIDPVIIEWHNYHTAKKIAITCYSNVMLHIINNSIAVAEHYIDIFVHEDVKIMIEYSDTRTIFDCKLFINWFVHRNAQVQCTQIIETESEYSSNNSIILKQNNANFNAAAIFITNLAGKQITEWNQTHECSNTTSAVVLGALTDNNAQVHTEGTIKIISGADNADAKQFHRHLVLSDTARVSSKPSLDVDHDSVSCAHGSYITYLDEESCWYLQSRGITLQRARTILKNAFINSIVPKITQNFSKYETSPTHGLKSVVLGLKNRSRNDI